MILNNLFLLDKLDLQENKLEALVHIDEQHEILRGHFPQQPVVPGVSMIELVKELLEQGLQCKLMMQQSSVIKFLTMFAPPHFTQANCQIQFFLFRHFVNSKFLSIVFLFLHLFDYIFCRLS